MDRCRVYDKPGIRRNIFSILSVEDFDAPLGKPFAGGVLCAVGTAYRYIVNTISFPALPGYGLPVGNGFCPGIFAGAFWRIILYII